MESTALRHPVSKVVGKADLGWLLRAGVEGAGSLFLHPPEFKFCTATGVSLLRSPVSLQSGSTWVPPFGAATLAQGANRGVRGLRQAALGLKLSRGSQRRADADPDVTLDLPPPGNYEFFSLPAASLAHALLALDPAKGVLYGWLPASRRWEVLEHEGVGVLAESRIDRMAWRCEVASEGLRSVMFLPTEEGLTCLVPDVVSMTFQAEYIGKAPAIGAPVQFDEQVWVPVRKGDGQLRFVSATPEGKEGKQVALPAESLSGMSLGQLNAPLADARIALWPSSTGQLVLRKLASGEFEASFLPWPNGIKAAFQFGSPFLSRDGTLWQLCFDSHLERYVYLQLGVEQPERHSATAPRLCTGIFNFRFAAKHKREPWQDPEHGDDSGTDEVVLPLLESTASAAALGLRVATSDGLAALLESDERMRAVMVLDDDTTQTAFHTVSVVQPWRMRAFVHDGQLWVYHPTLNKLHGWDLQS